MLPNGSASRWRHAVYSLFASITLLILSACGGSGGSGKTAPVTLVSIAVSPSTPSFALGLTQQLAAKGTYSNGSISDITNSVTWTSSATAVARVSTSGLVTSASQGTTTISATLNSITGSASVTVAPPALVSLSVSPIATSLALGLTQQFAAVGVYTDGGASDLSTIAAWTSSATSVATITSSGLVTSASQGTAIITAAVGSIKGTAALTVTPPAVVSLAVSPAAVTVPAGLTQQFTVSALYSDGTRQVPANVNWASSHPDEATVNSNGLATTLRYGQSSITASIGSIQGTATLTIDPPALTGISVTPANASIYLNTYKQFSAIGTFTDKSTSDVTSTASWQLGDSNHAQLQNPGAIQATHAGSTTLTATMSGISATADVAILAHPRFVYASTDASIRISRLVVNEASGQLRHWGYQRSQLSTSYGPSCVTADPTQTHLYITNTAMQTPGVYSSTIATYSINATTGDLNPLSPPQSISENVGCLQFTPDGAYAYALPGVTEATQQLVTLKKDDSGALSVIATTPLSDYAGSLAIDPLGKFLYLTTEQLSANAKASLYGYSIDAATGELTAIKGTPSSLPTNTFGMLAFHPFGQFLYISDLNGTSIISYAIDRSSGALTAGTTTSNVCINPSAPGFTPDGSIAFVSCGQGINRSPVAGNLVSLTVNSGGALTKAGTADAYLSPTALTVDPSGKYLYLISSGSHYVKNSSGSYTGGYNAILSYSINPDGTVTEVNEMAGRVNSQSLLVLGGAGATSIVDDWIFEAEYIAGDPLDPPSSQIAWRPLQGNLPQVSGGWGPVLDHPYSLTTVPWRSDILFASAKTAPNLQAVVLDPATGYMSNGVTFGTGTTPGAIVMDPSGIVAFASEPATGKVYWYGYAGLPGYWSNLETAPGVPAYFSAEAGAGPLAIDPAGRYLFVGNTKASSVSEFQFAGAAPKAAQPVPSSPLALATDPTGNLLFVAGKDNMLRMLQINVNGDLTDVADAALPGTPNVIAAEPSGHYLYVGTNSGMAVFSYSPKNDTLTSFDAKIAELATLPVTSITCDPSGTDVWVEAIPNPPDGTTFTRYVIQSDGTLVASYADPFAQVSSAAFWAHVQ